MYAILDTPFPIMAMTLSAIAVILLLLRGWQQISGYRSTMDGPGQLLNAAVSWLPDERQEWGMAMTAELMQIWNLSSRWRFALGCAWVALFPPRRRGMSVALTGNYGLGFAPPFDTWFAHWLGGELGSMITVLALVPGWLLFFGLIGGTIGNAMGGERKMSESQLMG